MTAILMRISVCLAILVAVVITSSSLGASLPQGGNA
jgi:hypothetical protein